MNYGNYAIMIIFQDVVLEIIPFITIMQKVGYNIEEIFKGSNILTRYF